MSTFDTMLDNMMASPLAIDILYTPTGLSQTSVRALSRTPDVDTVLTKGEKLRQQASIFEVLVVDLPTTAIGDTFQVNGVNYRVMNVYHKDQDRLVWTIEGAPT